MNGNYPVMSDIYKNSDVSEPIPGIKVASMKQESRNRMEKALDEYDKFMVDLRKLFPGRRKTVYSFAYWLFRHSGLV